MLLSKQSQRIVSFSLGVLLLLSSLCGCDQPSNTISVTFRDTITASSICLNPHLQQNDEEKQIAQLCETGLVRKDVKTDKWIFEMATSVEDITEVFENREKYQIQEPSGRVFRILLNPNAVWENGTKITAETYVQSMYDMLDPSMRNTRAAEFTDGAAAIWQAKACQHSGMPIYVPAVPAYSTGSSPDYSAASSESTLYFSFESKEMTFSSYSISEILGCNAMDEETQQILSPYTDAQGFIRICSETEPVIRNLAEEFMLSLGLLFSEDAYKEMLFLKKDECYPTVPFSELGLYATDEYSLLYITDSYCETDDVLEQLSTNWIVYEPLYEKGKLDSGLYTVTDYGTSMDTYMSYGSFCIESWEVGTSLSMKKNPSGIGSSFITATQIHYLYLHSYEDRKRLFFSGELDRLVLSADDALTYDGNAQRIQIPTATVLRFVFASDPEALAALEASKQENKTVLAYPEFRQALSCIMDRSVLCTATLPGFIPCDSLISTLDWKSSMPDTMQMSPSMQTAHDLFENVYQQAVNEDVYHDGQKIRIQCAVSSGTLTENDLIQENLLNLWIHQATQNTGFENQISIEFCLWDGDRYAAIADGKIEMIRGGWSARSENPLELIRLYTDPTYVNGIRNIPESCGWNPQTEPLTISLGNSTFTASFTEWTHWLSGQMVENGEFPEKLTQKDKTEILHQLENAVLSSFQCIPIAAEATTVLYSSRILFPTPDQNTITFQYNDTQWAQMLSNLSQPLYS